MLMKATVPNTHAAGLASLATWRARPKTSQPTTASTLAALANQEVATCECGLFKVRGKVSCERCSRFEAGVDMSKVVIDKLKQVFADGETYTVRDIIETLSYKFQEHVVGKACRDLLNVGYLVLVSTKRPYSYRRAS